MFYERGRQTRRAVRGELHADYDDTEALRIDIDTDATVQVDLLGIQATQSADAIADDAMLLFVVRASNSAQFEVMTLKEIRIADGEAFYRLKVRRARFGTARLSFAAGDRVWVIRRAALRFYEHQSFPAFASSGTTATFRLQARNLFGLEADVSDVLQCPDRTFAFSNSGIWIPSTPSGLSVSTGTGQFALAWADNSTNEAGFRLEWSTNLSTWNIGGTVGPGVVTTSIPGPPFNQTTYWRVVAYNAAGDSDPSNAAPGYLPDTLRLDVDRVGVTVIAQEAVPQALDVDRIGVTAVVQEAVVSALDLDRVGVTVIVQEIYP